MDVIIGAALFFIIPGVTNLVSGTTQPNVLFLVVDDLRPQLGCYGNDYMITPNIDQLASRSLKFKRAYIQQAVCAPSRVSFLTSRRPDTTHLYDFGSYWRHFSGNYTTLPQHFKEKGYITQSVGKIFHPGIPSGGKDDYPYSWTYPAWHPPTLKNETKVNCPGEDGRLHRYSVCPVDLDKYPDQILPDMQSNDFAINFLKNRANSKEPFFLAVGYHKPHLPFKYPREFMDLYPIETVKMAHDPWMTKDLPPVAWHPLGNLRETEDIKKLNVSFPWGIIPDQYQIKLRQSYYAATSYTDSLIGKLLETLDEQGLAENTIISFIGDHGWSLGEHGQWEKFSDYEWTTNTPLLISVPGVTFDKNKPVGKIYSYIDPFKSTKIKKSPKNYQQNLQRNTIKANAAFKMEQDTMVSNDGLETDAFVEAVDLFPSISEMAGLPIPPLCPDEPFKTEFCTEGVSFAPLLQKLKKNKVQGVKENVLWKKAAFSQYPRPQDQPEAASILPPLKEIKIMGYTMRTDLYRYTEWVGFDHKTFKPNWNDVHGKELYLHESDDAEDWNVQAKYPELVKTLSEQLHAGWRKALPLN